MTHTSDELLRPLRPAKWLALASLAVLAACPTTDDDGKTGTGGDTSDTDLDTDSGGGSENCDVHLVGTDPSTGAAGVYYRDPLTLDFDGDASAMTVKITDSAGVEAPNSVAWSEGNVQATVTAELSPSTNYTAVVDLCGAQSTVAFATSDIGAPIAEGNASLLGRVYGFSLNEAEITDPEILEAFDDQFFTQPLLFEVEAADDATITLLGAVGIVNDAGDLEQDTRTPTFDFPAADFTGSPFFSASTSQLTISYFGYEIPIYDFAFAGVFTSDGGSIVRGTVEGLVDTRNIGPMLDQGDEPDAACNFAASFGVYCELCPDGEELCLGLVGEQITAPEIEGIDVVEVTAE
jgi:hypothetical protein